MTKNPGKPPRTNLPLRVLWSIDGSGSKPYPKEVWRQFDWRLGRSNDILAVEFVRDGN